MSVTPLPQGHPSTLAASTPPEPTPAGGAPVTGTPVQAANDWGTAVLTSPWLWGTALSVGLYQAMNLFPAWDPFFNRYFRDHWILYTETISFCFAIAILARKLFGLRSEREALARVQLQTAALDPRLPASDRARWLTTALAGLPPRLHPTHWVTRIRQVAEFVLLRHSPGGVEEHLKYRADLALESQSASYAFVRTVTWAIPILGFLGTVIGITMALSSLKFDADQLAASFESALVGLGVAFDTTALALSLSLVLVFGTHLVERAEQQVLGQVEEQGVAQLAPLLADAETPGNPLTEAQHQAAQHLLHKTESLVNWQTGLWQSALEQLRDRWVETARSQQEQFQSTLSAGMQATLAGHAQDLQSARQEFLEGFRVAGEELRRVTDTLQAHASATQGELARQMTTTWERFESHLATVQTQQQTFVAESGRVVNEAFAGWHADLDRTVQALEAQLVEARAQSQSLRELAGQTAQLEHLQSTLSRNLHTVQALDGFEQAIASLNAAIHLLSARSRGWSAAA